MQQYQLNFGFREPYQVLGMPLSPSRMNDNNVQNIRRKIDEVLTNWGITVDAEMLRDADRFKMDLVGGLERTLQGEVKPSTSVPSHPDPALLTSSSNGISNEPPPHHQ